MKTDKNSQTTTAEGALLQPEHRLTASGHKQTATLLGTRQDYRFLRQHMAVRLSRVGLLAKGIHVDLTTIARKAGFRFHLFLRRDCYEKLTEQAQPLNDDEDLTAVIEVLRDVLLDAEDFDQPMPFQANGVALVAYANRVDFDDPRPAVTVALLNEGASDE